MKLKTLFSLKEDGNNNALINKTKNQIIKVKSVVPF